MPYIENCSQAAVEAGTHQLTPGDTILIQITDPDSDFVKPYFQSGFVHIYQTKFYDVTAPLWGNKRLIEPITQGQADNLVYMLDFAYRSRYNVLVHCTAGLCRSGAVAEVGVIMGFRAVHDNRMPNVEVKSKMMRALYDSF